MILFDIEIFTDNKRYLLKKFKAPVACFASGPKDVGLLNVYSFSLHRDRTDVSILV
jgi:hypothetical protein